MERINTSRQRTTRSLDGEVAPADGPLKLATVRSDGICSQSHMGARRAPNKIGERDDGRVERRLIKFIAVRNYKIIPDTAQ